MLSVVKRLGPTSEILRSAQHDSGGIRVTVVRSG